MATLTTSVKPSDFKTRYETLRVNLEDGSFQDVPIDRYRLRRGDDHTFFNPAGMTAFLNKLSSRGIDMDLSIITPILTERVSRDEAKKGTGLPSWSQLASYVFVGKGSPEACQIVLQLAQHWGLAPNLQDYAKNYLGLDCNGFVGNYLWHAWGDAKNWKDLGVVNGQRGPDCGISGYLEQVHRKSILDWNDLDISKSYILGRVGASGNIIDTQEGNDIAHIAITEPDVREDITLPDGSKTFAVQSVESTGANTPNPGLSFHSYKLRDPAKHKPAHGIFEIDRGTNISGGPSHRFVKFKIVERDVTLAD